jgi:protein O-GlcNAc transferase
MTIIEALRLALAHYHKGAFAETESVCRAVLRVALDQPEALMLLGVARFAADNPKGAETALRRMIAAAPGMAEGYANLGVVLQNAGFPAAGVAAQDRAVLLKPNSPEGYYNRGGARMTRGDRIGAAEDYFQVLALKPLDVGAANALGMALREMGHVERAVRAHRRVLSIDPQFAEGYRDFGHALRESGSLRESAVSYGRVALTAPGRTDAVNYELFTRQAYCDWSRYDALRAQVHKIVADDEQFILPLAGLSIDTTAEEQLRAARRFYRVNVQPRPQPEPPPRRRRAAADGRLTVAYGSADFHEHATAYLAAEMFELHDRSRFRFIAYSYGIDDGSPMRARLTAAFEVFRNVRHMGLDEVRAQAEADGVDIFVDLKGYTKQARLDLLSRRLAPVQVSYLGYPGTLGSDCMDYVIGDRFVTPMAHEPFYSEKIVQLPDSYQINDRRRPLDGRVPTRAEYGLPENAVVFCAFNTTYKINPMMFGAWMRLLQAEPGSVLWLFEANAEANDNLRREAASRGVDPARLVFAPKRPLADHLARHRLADLAVDSFPYTGHTTTSDALWTGLPVVTLLGETFASRVAAGLLNAAGLPETVATSLEAYEEMALRLARDPATLRAYRERLETTRMQVPLFDSLRFTRHMERAYETMWAVHESGAPPRSFAVPPISTSDA